MSRRPRTPSKSKPSSAARSAGAPALACPAPPQTARRQKLLLIGAISLEILWLALLILLAISAKGR
jgi:hypothetical protein